MPKIAWPSIVSIALFAGCNGNSANVTGTVTLDGQPLTTGSVSFQPTTSGPVAYGSIGPEGNYQLSTGTSTGLNAGEYIVTVVATEEARQPAPGEPELPPKLLTPERYGNVEQSGLRFTVTRGANKIDLPLTTK